MAFVSNVSFVTRFADLLFVQTAKTFTALKKSVAIMVIIYLAFSIINETQASPSPFDFVTNSSHSTLLWLISLLLN